MILSICHPTHGGLFPRGQWPTLSWGQLISSGRDVCLTDVVNEDTFLETPTTYLEYLDGASRKTNSVRSLIIGKRDCSIRRRIQNNSKDSEFRNAASMLLAELLDSLF